ncbi:MAG TPA: M1 family aminopeptidase, partial [Candidatus Nitrosocosmicus sp.]|nr:M1 family aminopeptidase [Candidatus Nitrosocosmicus sp.]
LKSFLGESNFQKSIKQYLNRYKNSTVTSNDLLQTIEEVSGVEVQIFFDQWIYRKGHPEIEIEYTLIRADNDPRNNNLQVNKLKIKVIQTQSHLVDQAFLPPYQFELEIKIIIEDILGRRKEIPHLMQISQWTSESTVEFDRKYSISYISIDPYYKILKTIRSIKVQNESEDLQLRKILLNQLKFGDTVVERIQSARMLKNLFSDQIVNSLRDSIQLDKFYGVGKEAANAIGSFHDRNNYEKSDNAYRALVSGVLEKKDFESLNNHVKRVVIKNIGLFERTDSIELFEAILKDSTTNSDFIRSAAAAALGSSSKRLSAYKEKKRVLLLLKDIVNNSKSFQSVLATGALEGLSELSRHNYENDKEIYIETIDFLLQNTHSTKDYFIRAKSTRQLGKYLRNRFLPLDHKVAEKNHKVFCRLKELLKDERRKIRMNACEALSDDESKFAEFPEKITYESLLILTETAKMDLDAFVRRKAETSANRIRKWIYEWSSRPLSLE